MPSTKPCLDSSYLLPLAPIGLTDPAPPCSCMTFSSRLRLAASCTLLWGTRLQPPLAFLLPAKLWQPPPPNSPFSKACPRFETGCAREPAVSDSHLTTAPLTPGLQTMSAASHAGGAASQPCHTGKPPLFPALHPMFEHWMHPLHPMRAANLLSCSSLSLVLPDFRMLLARFLLSTGCHRLTLPLGHS